LGIKTHQNKALLKQFISEYRLPSINDYENLDSKEFFINKATGWSLRQYARTDPKAVKKFVESTQLHPLSRREAMKHIEE